MFVVEGFVVVVRCIEEVVFDVDFGGFGVCWFGCVCREGGDGLEVFGGEVVVVGVGDDEV